MQDDTARAGLNPGARLIASPPHHLPPHHLRVLQQATASTSWSGPPPARPGAGRRPHVLQRATALCGAGA
ncbi:hypothetical protein [Actinoplanes sp. CA-252034]|uniref:hypothetical protein n=1 Tax=Actinoplanes sp. CA-252034 TaxID=3239906 RepID=UPI003D998F35